MKFIFDIINFAINSGLDFEKKRLAFGKKFDESLNVSKAKFLNASKMLIQQKYFGFFACFLVVLFSLYKRSTIDIGNDSGVYLEIAQKIIEGKKYYHDFFEYNFPLSFLWLSPPIYIANFFKVSPLIIADYYVNILAVFSLFYSYQIIKKSDKFSSQSYLNIYIICLAVGFFIRPKTLLFNEFLTKSSLLLILIFPLISYILLGLDNLKLGQKFILGFLYATVCFVKPNFSILIFCFEAFNIYKSRKIKELFSAHLYFFAIFSVVYFFLIWLYFEDFLANLTYMMSLYNEYKNNHSTGYIKSSIFSRFCFVMSVMNRQLILYLFLLVAYAKMLKFSNLLKLLFVLALANLVIVISENYCFDQLVIFYCLFLPFVTFGFIIFNQQYKVSYQDYRLTLIALILFCFYNTEGLGYIQSNLLFHSSLSLLILSILYLFVDKKLLLKYRYFLSISLLSLALWLLLVNFQYLKIFIFISFLLILFKNRHHKFFFNIITIIILVGTFTFYGSFFKVIAGNIVYGQVAENYLKSPNPRNSELFKIKNNYLQENENMIIVSKDIFGSYSFRNYANLANKGEFSNYDIITMNIKYPSYHRVNEQYEKKAKDSFYRQITDKNNKIITFFFIDYCGISFLEFFLQDKKIHDYLVKNFDFLTAFYEHEDKDVFDIRPTKKDLTESEFIWINDIYSNLILNKKAVNYNAVFEVFIRK